MKKIGFASFCYLFLLVACSKKDEIVKDPFDPLVSKILKDEAYGTLAIQKADIYLPANRGLNTNTIVLLHGGFWATGDKNELDSLMNPIRAALPDLTIVNMNFRLSDDAIPSNRHPAQMNDISLLLDYLDQHAAQWHINNKYALTGISSGGHLALLYTYVYDTRKKIKIVSSVLGPTNFADPIYINSALFQQVATTYLGKTWLQDSALHKSVSPVLVVNSGAPPTFLAYGGADPIIPVSNPVALNAKLEALGITHQFYLYPTESHDMSRAAIQDLITKMAAFYLANF